jgi:hypothetical protein
MLETETTLLREQLAFSQSEAARWQEESAHWRGHAEQITRLLDQQQQLALPDRMKDLPALPEEEIDAPAQPDPARRRGLAGWWEKLQRRR